MTLIAFAAYDDHAELITDTCSYTPNLSSIGHTTKHLTIPHLDVAVLTQGDSAFGNYAKLLALDLASEVPSFDEMIAAAPDLLQRLWENVATESTSDTLIALVGYSAETERFDAQVFASERGFKPIPARGLWVLPSPWTLRANGVEMRRFKHLMDAMVDTQPERAENYRQALELWKTKPAPQTPRSLEDWRRLAIAVREQRTLQHFCHVLVAGRVSHTRIERGGRVTTQTIHEFNDAGDEFLQMVGFTDHPVSQMKPCDCGSGLRWRDCCLAAWYADGHPCDCGSGRPFVDCCRVNEPAQVAAADRSVI